MTERSDNGFCIIYIALSSLVLDVDLFTFLCNHLGLKILCSHCFALLFLRILLYGNRNAVVSISVLQLNRNISLPFKAQRLLYILPALTLKHSAF
jgi:hypothetical protein